MSSRPRFRRRHQSSSQAQLRARGVGTAFMLHFSLAASMVGCYSTRGERSWPDPPDPGFVPQPRPNPNDYSWVGEYDPGKHPRISLLTVAPQKPMLDRFGESALRVRLRPERVDLVYTHCVPRLDTQITEAQLTRQYVAEGVSNELRVIPYANFMQRFADGERGVVEQELNLDFAQARHLAKQLELNASQGQRVYRFDAFSQTCATRTRDLIDVAINGRFRDELEARPARVTLRQEVLRHFADQRLQASLFDAFLGPYADRPLSEWEAAFLPANLKHSVEMLRSEGAHGSWVFVKEAKEVVKGGAWRVSSAPPDHRGDNLRAGLIVGALSAVLGARGGRSPRRGFQLAASGVLTLLTLILATLGCFMVAFWLDWEHAVLVRNANVLAFGPWTLLALAGWLWSLRDRRALTWWVGCIASGAIGCAAAGAIRLLKGTSQDNLSVIALVLPIWVGLSLAAYWFRQEQLMNRAASKSAAPSQ